jgi:hypothetical protein
MCNAVLIEQLVGELESAFVPEFFDKFQYDSLVCFNIHESLTTDTTRFFGFPFFFALRFGVRAAAWVSVRSIFLSRAPYHPGEFFI